MGQELLLVGSVPLKSVEDVMRTFGGALGRYLPAIPDGEVGERRSWVLRLSYQVFNGHIDLDTIKRPARVNGREQLMPQSPTDVWQFKVKPGVDAVRFGNPGYRLGYAKDAVTSYFVFKTMRERGVIPPGVRFQISMPMVNSVVRPLIFPDPADLARVRPGYEEAIAAELDAILDAIPHEDLAIQWDLAWEVNATSNPPDSGADRASSGGAGTNPIVPGEGDIAMHVAPVGRLSKKLPDKVALGFHFCFGTFGGWPRFEPKDLGSAVDLVNAAVAATGRRVDWVHIPALDRTNDDFYAPLKRLEVGAARVYLGLIHSMANFKERFAAARRALPEFGLAAYCGFGRIAPEEMPKILEDHLTALKIAGKV